MRGFVRRLLGGDRPKVIAILAVTGEDARSCVLHARSNSAGLPIWVWCAEDLSSLTECNRFAGRATALMVLRDIRSVWPALTIVSWSGERGFNTLKLTPFLLLPFRFVVRNEAGGFFSGRPLALLRHAAWRLKDGVVAGGIRAGEWTVGGTLRVARFAAGIARLLWSLMLRAIDRLWSGFLAIAALIAPAFWFLAYSRSRKPSGRRYLSVTQHAPKDRTWTEVIVEDRRWRRGRLLAALRSDASFVVFRHPNCKASAEPLLELAANRNAFSVAQQAAYTGWRRQVIARHPFRTLQTNEVASVLAPNSPLFVVNRETMLKLGLPTAVTFGGGIASVFRRAAAAGFEAWTMGGTAPLDQEPAMALEDVELAMRWEDVSPRLPELRKGNLAQASSGGRGFRGKPRVLVVSPYLPFPLSHGGAVRIYNLCRELSADVDFVLACFREVNEAVQYNALHEVFREVYVVDIDERAVDVSVPKQVVEYRNSAMRSLISDLCRNGIDLLQLEYTQMAEYRDCAAGVPVILVEHDITFTLYEQLSFTTNKDSLVREFQLWRRFEREALAAVSRVWTMSQKDRAVAVENGAEESRTFVIPNGVDLVRFKPAAKTNPAPVILFVGSFRHLPNLLAFEVLVRDLMPSVRKMIPDAHLEVIAGPDHEKAAESAGKQSLIQSTPDISIQGFVEDLRPIYRECDVVVIPLPLSAGTNIKLMEAMACGRAVVSSPPGCAGLELTDGEDLVIRDIGPAFADAIIDLLQNQTTRSRIGVRARQTAEKRFGWDAIARDALASYEETVGRDLVPADTLVITT